MHKVLKSVYITIKIKYLRVGIFSIFYAIYFTLRKHKQLVHVYVIELKFFIVHVCISLISSLKIYFISRIYIDYMIYYAFNFWSLFYVLLAMLFRNIKNK